MSKIFMHDCPACGQIGAVVGPESLTMHVIVAACPYKDTLSPQLHRAMSDAQVLGVMEAVAEERHEAALDGLIGLIDSRDAAVARAERAEEQRDRAKAEILYYCKHECRPYAGQCKKCKVPAALADDPPREFPVGTQENPSYDYDEALALSEKKGK